MRRIICLGNEYIRQDSAGLEVARKLALMSLPEDVEVVEGGLAGLDLLSLVENSERFISHELKNTLGVIYTSARALDMGLTGPLNEKQAGLVGGIARNIDV